MCVRSSITFYGNFNLDMDRSPGFGSTNTNFTPYSDLVSLRLHTFLVFNLANISNSPDRSTKSTQSATIPYGTIRLPLFVSTRFQVLFHSPPGVLFTFPSQYYALSVTKEYLGLRGGPRSFHQGFSCLDVLWIPLSQFSFRLRGFHPLRQAFPNLSARITES